MKNSLYKGKLICACEIINCNRALEYSLKKEWKLAGINGELKCPLCGSEVILRTSKTGRVVPHFAHKVSKKKCPYSEEIKESKDHKIGKEILFNYFRETYTDVAIAVDYFYFGRRRADLFLKFRSGKKLAIEFQRTDLSTMDLIERQDSYDEAGVNIVWIFMGIEKDIFQKKRQEYLTFMEQYMLNEKQKTAVYLDLNSGKIILVKNIRYKNKYKEKSDVEELFIKSYYLKEIYISENGNIECDFLAEYNKASEEFFRNCETLYERKIILEREEKEELGQNESIEISMNIRKSNLNQKTEGRSKKNYQANKKLIETSINKNGKSKVRIVETLYKEHLKKAFEGNNESLKWIKNFIISKAERTEISHIEKICRFTSKEGSNEARRAAIKILKS